MKIYEKPIVRINQVHSSDMITTSEPQINGDESDPNEPVLAPERDSDWKNW